MTIIPNRAAKSRYHPLLSARLRSPGPAPSPPQSGHPRPPDKAAPCSQLATPVNSARGMAIPEGGADMSPGLGMTAICPRGHISVDFAAHRLRELAHSLSY